jgi:hypothetical protein
MAEKYHGKAPSCDISVANVGIAKVNCKKVGWLLKARPGMAGLVVIKGGPSELYTASDMPRPFRQLRHFFYMSGYA